LRLGFTKIEDFCSVQKAKLIKKKRSFFLKETQEAQAFGEKTEGLSKSKAF